MKTSIRPNDKPLFNPALQKLSEDSLKYQRIRSQTLALCENLEIEDYVVQPREEISPPKWHLAHTTWFFEEMLLKPYFKDYSSYNERFSLLFNSYYKAKGNHWDQGLRGNLSRPTVSAIKAYRYAIDQSMLKLLNQDIPKPEIIHLLDIGLNHEQQHQELLIMDIKAILNSHPFPIKFFSQQLPEPLSPQTAKPSYKTLKEGLYQVGSDSPTFSYDNEKPRHKIYQPAVSLREALSSNGQYLEFIEDGGYQNPKYWLSEGWNWVQKNQINHPLYWSKQDADWYEFTLYGNQKLQAHQPVCHISYFEADAFAKWSQHRLPSEFEMELFLTNSPSSREISPYFHATNCTDVCPSLWCWTQSAYSPYPGFQTFRGALEEYNGKFMCNQYVLRGGCVATPAGHFRATYRNFYKPEQRWMFSGIRLAKDL